MFVMLLAGMALMFWEAIAWTGCLCSGTWSWWSWLPPGLFDRRGVVMR